ncbi:DsbA family protein [Salinibius halmophilus]|uniref:DsbA family protein n=1 Tax=Salinibius halmophilus TaxID=1853216 RepID=UPI000E665993|nr:DsbA family protein [Salinibius halmophilus]
MKQLLAVLAISLFSVSVYAGEFNDGEHYQRISDNATESAEVRLYFSYNCSHCSVFDPVYEAMLGELQASGSDINVTHTHVDFVGRNGADMTWARSMGKLLQVEQQTAPIIFDAIHTERRSLSRADVRDIFLSAGVTAQDFDAAAESFAVQGLQAQQRKQAIEAKLKGVPTVIVNGKYQINRGSVSTPEQLAKLVEYVASLE